jgi:hypothetical protein
MSKGFEVQSARSGKSGSERRVAPRFPPSAIPGLKSVRLATADADVQLLNMSRTGALIEGMTRLSPKSPVSIRLTAGSRSFILRGRVVRSQVCGYDGEKLRYRSALKFDEDFLMLPAEEGGIAAIPLEPAPVDEILPLAAVQVAESKPHPAVDVDRTPPDYGRVTFNARCGSVEELQDLLRANDW